MKSLPDGKKRPLGFPREFRCVWMSAGILSYQLCDLEFDCEHCSLDSAMRKHFDHHAKEQHCVSPHTARYLYSHNHCWLNPSPDSIVRIGLEPWLAGLLLTPKAVVFPSTGDFITRHSTCLWIIMEGGAITILSPLAGVVHSANARITEEPHELCSQPLGRGWLYELKVTPDELQAAGLLGKAEAERSYREDNEKLNSLVSQSLANTSKEIGFTLQDGGQPLSDVISMLGPKRYVELLRQILR